MKPVYTKLNYSFKYLILLIMTGFMVGCGGGGSVQSTAASAPDGLTLSVDQMSPVPLVNDKPQTFYMYITNYGKNQVSNLNWTASTKSSSLSVSNSLSVKVKNIFSTSAVQAQDAANPITITDQSQCLNIAPGQVCRITLSATNPGVVVLSTTSGSSTVTLTGGGGVVQANNSPTNNTGNPTDTLTFSPITNISFGGSGGSYNFYVINNGTNPVILTATSFVGLPANVTLQLGYCPNPLPSGSACQARLVITNPSGSTDQNLSIPLNLTGNVLNPDGTTTPLPTQNADTSLSATNAVVGVLQTILSQSVVVDASSGTALPVNGTGLISNSGTGPLTITSVASGNSSLISITNDTCSGKTLGAGDICYYTPGLTVAAISGSGSATVNIVYTTGSGTANQTQATTVKWAYIAPLPAAAPAITFAVTPSNLTQAAEFATATVTNTGNVDLINLTAPTMSPANPHLSIANATCNGNLAKGASCTYTLTYSPAAPSENSAITLSGITANYLDNNGSSQSSSFSNSAGVTLSSIFAGSLSASGTLNLTTATPGGTVTFTNEGNSKATIASVTLGNGSSTNLQIAAATSGNNCSSTLVLNPGDTCGVQVSLVNTASAGSGNGSVVLTYNNSNGTANATASNSNIGWLIGDAPNLNVSFANSNLTTTLNVPTSTIITLTNNGNDTLSNIVLPTVSAPLQLSSGATNGCGLSGQSLTNGQSCTLTITYTPTVAQSTASTVLGIFSATYAGSSTYTTSPYNITLTAITTSNVSPNLVNVTQNVNWINPQATNSVLLTNNGQSTATITGISSNDPQVTTSGCSSATLISAGTCTLTINGNYTTTASNSTTNATVIVSYIDAQGTKSFTLGVTGNFTAQPVVTPSLSVLSTPLFGQTINQTTGTTSTAFPVMLTNNSHATNGGNASISIPYAGLLPVSDSYSSYTMDTTGINTNPCSLPNSDNSMTLAAGSTCSYNVYITTTATPTGAGVPETLNIGYNYNVYPASGSATPVLTPATLVVNNFTLNTSSPTAQLGVRLAKPSTGNEFNAIQQGVTPNPSISLTIYNSGSGPVSGSITAQTLPAGISLDLSACPVSLAANASCTATLTMSTANIITAANLNTSSISYNNGTVSTTTPLPSISYSVVAVTAPAITMTPSVSGCATGTGIAPITCYNNPNSMGGNASTIQVTLTFTNSSSTPVTALTLQAASIADFTSQGYTQVSNTCGSGIAASGGTCTIVYLISSIAASSAIQPSITDTAFTYNYTYGSQGQLSVVSASSIILSIDVVAPALSIGTISPITQGSSGTATLTWSNLYQSSVPTTSTSATARDDTPVTGLSSATPATCGAVVSNGASCTSVITTTADTPVVTGVLNATATGVAAIPMPFNVTGKIIFITSGTYSGGLGGTVGADKICNTEAYGAGSIITPGLTFEALLVTSGRYPCDSSGNCGGDSSSNWPLIAGVIYVNSDLTAFNTVNANYVFDGSYSNFKGPTGAQSLGSFWSGIQSVRSSGSANDIIAWAQADVNPTADATVYEANYATCVDFTSSSPSDNGSIGVSGIAPGFNGTIPSSTWGNYLYFNDSDVSSNSYVYNAYSYSHNSSCDSALAIICVQQ